MHDPEQIEVQMETQGKTLIVRPFGDIDLSRAPSLRTHLTKAQDAGHGRIVVDLAAVPYMDSSGVATLVEAMQVARRKSTKLVLCSMQSKVRSIFEIARLDMVFTIVDTTEEALVV